MSCDASEEYPDVQRQQHRRARKEHKCCACKETIRRGDLYWYVFVIFEGVSEEWKRCLRCEKMHDEIQDALGDGQVPDPNLNCGHSWEELHGECPPEIARLAFLTPAEAQAELAPKQRELVAR